MGIDYLLSFIIFHTQIALVINQEEKQKHIKTKSIDTDSMLQPTMLNNFIKN